MFMEMFAVFGNPIQHSKSPSIHKMFAEQTGILLEYEKILAPVDNFELSLAEFFSQGGKVQTLLCHLKKGHISLFLS